MDKQPLVFVLDAGGTGLKFSAVSDSKEIIKPFTIQSAPNSINDMIERIISGFERVGEMCGSKPMAISFSFPGPADYENGIIGDLPNLPCFRGGVPLKAILEDKFKVPVFINNDGDLFAYGEALAGFLPYVNNVLKEKGNPKQYKNLLGVTLGTGFGGGIVIDGKLLSGDNSAGGEIWCTRNMAHTSTNVEDSLTVRAVRRIYSENSGISMEHVPQPVDIFNIALGKQQGDCVAAQKAWDELGTVLADAISGALTLVDGLVVIGGGLSGAWPVFFPALMRGLSAPFHTLDDKNPPRLELNVFNLQDENELDKFSQTTGSFIDVPSSGRKIWYDPNKKTGVGVSRLGTSSAVAVGAYQFAKQQLGF